MRMFNKTLTGVAVVLGMTAGAAMAQEFNLAFTPPLESHYGDGGKACLLYTSDAADDVSTV